MRRRRREKTMIENMITPTPFGDTPDDKLEGKYDKSHSKWNEESALDQVPQVYPAGQAPPLVAGPISERPKDKLTPIVI